MANNTEHIKALQSILPPYYRPCRPDAEAVRAAIRALRNEGKPPWRKVGKKHPGKKWGYADRFIAALSDGRVVKIEQSPIDLYVRGWEYDGSRIIAIQPWPEYPEEVK